MKQNEENSLMVLLRDDPDFAKRIKEVAKEIEKDSLKIKNVADKYNRKYEREIEEGTTKRNLLIEDGEKRGKTVQEVEISSGFIPSIYTPILNWLYFFMKEEKDEKRESMRTVQDSFTRELLQEETEFNNVKETPDPVEYIYGNITMERFQTLKKLKRLSKSPNEHEAFAAYRKCLELCKLHKIEFDKIPD